VIQEPTFVEQKMNLS